MRVLVATAMWPTAENQSYGIFVKREVEALRAFHQVDVTVDHRAGGRSRYLAFVIDGLGAGKFDVVHAHYGLTGAALLSARSPLVVTYHGSDTRGWPGLVSRIVAKRADWNIAVSDAVATALATDRVSVSPMPVDDETFHPGNRTADRRDLGWEDVRPVVLFGGDPRRKVKGYELFHAVTEALHRDIRPELLVEDQPVAPEIVAKKLRAADVLLFTSIVEGSPLIVREALASGLPVVSVDVGDVAEVLRGQAGCYVVDRRVDDLAEAVLKSLSSDTRPDHRAAVCQWGRKAASDRVFNIYRSLA